MKQSMSINAEITRQNDKILLDKGVLLVNRSDEPGIYSFDLKSYGVKVNSTVNFLDDQIVPVNDVVINAELQSGNCLLAVVQKKEYI
jgi:hypothetical protein